MNGKVDIVVRSKNGHSLLHEALRSIAENTNPDLVGKLVIVDDGSKPALGATIAEALPEPWQEKAVYTRHAESKGAVTATNAGLRLFLEGSASYVMVCDNDIVIPAGDRDWLLRFVDALNVSPETGAVGATTNFANPPQHVLTVPVTFTADWQDKNGQRGGVKENPAVPSLVSFCCLLRREAVEECGLWDERYNPGNYEDTDYAMTLRCAGWEVRVAQSVFVKHVGHQTFGEDLQRLLNENFEKFVGKWGLGRLWDMGLVRDETLAQVLMGGQDG